ncbi:orange carotenoid protein N-terminal domain-containing protein [Leptolyngbyaceae cyanobacterium UHCC 1019]
MTSVTSNVAPEQVKAFQALDVDQQLALFYFIYEKMGDTVTPAAPGASKASPEIAEGLFTQVKELSFEDQLQLQRDLITGKDTVITREYAALSDTTKLLFWYLLAQGMDSNQIIPMPPDYQLSGEANQLLTQVQDLGFEKQIAFFRDIVSPMGFDATGA